MAEPLTIAAKLSILDVCGGPGYTSRMDTVTCGQWTVNLHIHSEYGEIRNKSSYLEVLWKDKCFEKLDKISRKPCMGKFLLETVRA